MLYRSNYFYIQLISFLPCLLIILSYSSVSADRGSGKNDPDLIMDRLQVRLNLTDEQVEKIRPIIEDRIDKRLELIEMRNDQDRAEMQSLRNEMQELKNESQRLIESILTEDQIVEYRKMQEERSGGAGQRKRSRFSD